MKPIYFLPFFALLLILLTSNANAGASGLRVRCEGSDVGAEVSVNGKFKGECPLVIEVVPGSLTLRAFKKDSNYDYVFEQDIRLGDGVVKNIDVVLEKRLNAAGQKAENERLAAERVRAERQEAQRQETLRQQRETLLAKQTAYLAKGPEMIAIPDKNYEMGKFEVTRAEWRAVMGNIPSQPDNSCDDSCPVVYVSWNSAQVFIQKLSSSTGKQFRLPTKDEWMYACYGGQDGFWSHPKYCGGDDLDAVGWYEGNSNDGSNRVPHNIVYLHPVGKKRANGYGLYDMTGNVGEWTSTCEANECTYLGSSFDSAAFQMGSSYLYSGFGLAPTFSNYSIGFRLARTLP